MHVELRSFYYGGGGVVRFGRPLGRPERVQVGQLADQIGVGVEHVGGGLRGVGRGRQDFTRLVVLVPDVADGPNRLLDNANLLFHVGMGQVADSRRPAADRQGVGAVVGRDAPETSRGRDLVELLVDALGDERHERVQQTQRAVEHEGQNVLRHRASGFIAHAEFDPFEVPVAEVVPEEAIELRQRLAELEGFE